MAMTKTGAPELFHVWITKVDRWQPGSWQDLPPEATAIELAEVGCFNEAEALAYLEGHNTAALACRDRRWAVALPVVLSFAGDPCPGEVIFPQRMALSPATAP